MVSNYTYYSISFSYLNRELRESQNAQHVKEKPITKMTLTKNFDRIRRNDEAAAIENSNIVRSVNDALKIILLNNLLSNLKIANASINMKVLDSFFVVFIL